MVTAAAFHRVLGRPTGGALRPQLLAAVRDMVKAWAAQDAISALLPELRKPTGARGLRAARSVTAERRQLAERAFLALPGASQCLLWHTEVEAEPITVPAGLLGVDPGTASAGLERAREQFRAGCVDAHRELAPTRECRYYNRLLDVPIRRGGDLLPDVRQHLTECRYCRHAAEQLSHFEGALDVLLAETVLGWGARRYLDSRPARGGARPGSDTRRQTGGRHRPARPAPPPRRRAKAFTVGAGLTSLVLFVTALTAKGWSEDNGAPDPRATWGAPSGNSVHPGELTRPTTAGSPSAASAADPAAIAQGRLRNVDSGLCLDLRDGAPRADIRAQLAVCSSGASQQWSYRHDGLLRSAADPTLCLDSDAEDGTVDLADCLVHAGEVRYDLTVHGELLPRGSDGLAVAPGKGDSVVVAERNGSTAQRWLLDTGTGDRPETQSGPRTTDPEKRPSGGSPRRAPEPESPESPESPGAPDAPVPAPAPVPASPDAERRQEPQGERAEQPEPRHSTRYVEADSGDDDTRPVTPADGDAILPATAPPATAPDTVADVTATPVRPVGHAPDGPTG
jgi:hypothetical protein